MTMEREKKPNTAGQGVWHKLDVLLDAASAALLGIDPKIVLESDRLEQELPRALRNLGADSEQVRNMLRRAEDLNRKLANRF